MGDPSPPQAAVQDDVSIAVTSLPVLFQKSHLLKTF
jgi:hypothetical protein